MIPGAHRDIRIAQLSKEFRIPLLLIRPAFTLKLSLFMSILWWNFIVIIILLFTILRIWTVVIILIILLIMITLITFIFMAGFIFYSIMVIVWVWWTWFTILCWKVVIFIVFVFKSAEYFLTNHKLVWISLSEELSVPLAFSPCLQSHDSVRFMPTRLIFHSKWMITF